MEEFQTVSPLSILKRGITTQSTKELQMGQWDLDKRQGGAAEQRVSYRERNCCHTCPLNSKPQEQEAQAKWILQGYKPQLHAMYGPHGDIWSAEVLCWLQDTQPFTVRKPRERDSTKQCPTPEKRKGEKYEQMPWRIAYQYIEIRGDQKLQLLYRLQTPSRGSLHRRRKPSGVNINMINEETIMFVLNR